MNENNTVTEITPKTIKTFKHEEIQINGVTISNKGDKDKLIVIDSEGDIRIKNNINLEGVKSGCILRKDGGISYVKDGNIACYIYTKHISFGEIKTTN